MLTKRCRKCGGSIPDDNMLCPHCGALASPQAPDPQPKAQSAGSVCATCGAPLRAGAKFCTSCGAAVAAPAQETCPECGRTRLMNAKFCNGCGHPFTPLAPQPLYPRAAEALDVCPKCFAPKTPGAKFCRICGEPLLVQVSIPSYGYDEDYGQEFDQEYDDYSSEYSQSFVQNYSQSYGKEYNQEFDQEYGRDYDQEYSQEYSPGYSKDSSQNYSQNYSQGYGTGDSGSYSSPGDPYETQSSYNDNNEYSVFNYDNNREPQESVSNISRFGDDPLAYELPVEAYNAQSVTDISEILKQSASEIVNGILCPNCDYIIKDLKSVYCNMCGTRLPKEAIAKANATMQTVTNKDIDPNPFPDDISESYANQPEAEVQPRTQPQAQARMQEVPQAGSWESVWEARETARETTPAHADLAHHQARPASRVSEENDLFEPLFDLPDPADLAPADETPPPPSKPNDFDWTLSGQAPVPGRESASAISAGQSDFDWTLSGQAPVPGQESASSVSSVSAGQADFDWTLSGQAPVPGQESASSISAVSSGQADFDWTLSGQAPVPGQESATSVSAVSSGQADFDWTLSGQAPVPGGVGASEPVDTYAQDSLFGFGLYEPEAVESASSANEAQSLASPQPQPVSSEVDWTLSDITRTPGAVSKEADSTTESKAEIPMKAPEQAPPVAGAADSKAMVEYSWSSFPGSQSESHTPPQDLGQASQPAIADYDWSKTGNSQAWDYASPDYDWTLSKDYVPGMRVNGRAPLPLPERRVFVAGKATAEQTADFASPDYDWTLSGSVQASESASNDSSSVEGFTAQAEWTYAQNGTFDWDLAGAPKTIPPVSPRILPDPPVASAQEEARDLAWREAMNHYSYALDGSFDWDLSRSPVYGYGTIEFDAPGIPLQYAPDATQEMEAESFGEGETTLEFGYSGDALGSPSQAMQPEAEYSEEFALFDSFMYETAEDSIDGLEEPEGPEGVPLPEGDPLASLPDDLEAEPEEPYGSDFGDGDFQEGTFEEDLYEDDPIRRILNDAMNSDEGDFEEAPASVEGICLVCGSKRVYRTYCPVCGELFRTATTD